MSGHKWQSATTTLRHRRVYKGRFDEATKTAQEGMPTSTYFNKRACTLSLMSCDAFTFDLRVMYEKGMTMSRRTAIKCGSAL